MKRFQVVFKKPKTMKNVAQTPVPSSSLKDPFKVHPFFSPGQSSAISSRLSVSKSNMY